MTAAVCPDCSHELGEMGVHGSAGCDMAGCSCKRNERGKIAGKRGKRPDDLRSRLEALADRGRANGPALREMADEVNELLEYLESAVNAANELAEAADSYEGAEEGRDGAEERAEAWEQAQTAATDLHSALDDIDARLNETSA